MGLFHLQNFFPGKTIMEIFNKCMSKNQNCFWGSQNGQNDVKKIFFPSIQHFIKAQKTVLDFGHTIIEYLHDGLKWETRFAKEKVSFPQMTMGTFSKKNDMARFG